jgi:hypothetical protein
MNAQQIFKEVYRNLRYRLSIVAENRRKAWLSAYIRDGVGVYYAAAKTWMLNH